MSLNLFPARVAIGLWRGPDGKDVEVFSTPEFVRALAGLMQRIGGSDGLSTEDLAILVAQALLPTSDAIARDAVADIELSAQIDYSAQITALGRQIDALTMLRTEAAPVAQVASCCPDTDLSALSAQVAQIAALSQQVEELRLLVSTLASSASELAELRKRVDDIGQVEGSIAELAELRKHADDIEQIAAQPEQVRVNWERPGTIGSLTQNTGAFTTISASGQITSTLATGTAPLVVSSTTKVANLNADQVDGGDWAAPGAIGSTTPAAGSFTRVNATTSTVGLPGIYLSTENTTGLYRIGANNWGYAISGVKAIDYGTTRIDYSIDSMAVLTKSFYCFSAQFGMGTPDSSGLQIFCGNADIMRFGHRDAGLVFTEDMRIDANGDVKVYTKFGCNSKAPQGAYALGAASTDLPTVITLANNIRLALIANGIGS